MFLSMFEHAGETWIVDLQVIPGEDAPGVLEFAFERAAADGLSGGAPLTWRVSGDSLKSLSEHGVDISEKLLRRQLVLALAEARPADATGI